MYTGQRLTDQPFNENMYEYVLYTQNQMYFLTSYHSYRAYIAKFTITLKMESQGKTLTQNLSLEESLDNLLAKKYRRKIKAEIDTSHLIPFIGELVNRDYLLPHANGTFPSLPEKDINFEAQAYFVARGWQMVAYECNFNNMEVDLLMYKPGPKPFIGVVEVKVGNAKTALIQALSRIQTINHHSVVAYGFTTSQVFTFATSLRYSSDEEFAVPENI